MSGNTDGTAPEKSGGKDAGTRLTVLVALGANLLIAVAKAVGGVFAGSPALLSEAAHSVADSFNEVFLLAALRRSRRPPDRRHPFGYGKERFFWSLLAAVGIFVMGGCFSVFQGIEALRSGADESHSGYVAGLVVLGVAFLAEGGSLLRALHQVRGQPGGGIGRDPALRTVVAEDGTAVLGVALAIAGMALHMATGQPVWEGSASLAIGVLLGYVAYRLGKDARDQLIGEAVDPENARPHPGAAGRAAGDRQCGGPPHHAARHRLRARRGPYRPGAGAGERGGRAGLRARQGLGGQHLARRRPGVPGRHGRGDGRCP